MCAPDQVINCVYEASVCIKESIDAAARPRFAQSRLSQSVTNPGRADVSQRRIHRGITAFHREPSNIAWIRSGSRVRVSDPLHAVLQSSKGNQFVIHVA